MASNIFFNITVVLSLFLYIPEGDAKSWALLVAGSSHWFNYRHQADVCHSYQILKAHGVPNENIIVMMYDDIAFNDANPTPGKIINKPKGRNVYKGVPKDYTGNEVRPSVFLNVLNGEDPLVGSRKVINSTEEDNVFVYFSDHGGPGILGFPSDYLDALDLNKTIYQMKRNNRFKKLVFYIEACESGSMFDGILSKHGGVYAMTASNEKQSSYACFYSQKYDTYLGDVFSVNWLQDADKEDLENESIERQYSIVRTETNTSQVSQYGDKKIAASHLSEFLGHQAKAFEEKPGFSRSFSTISSRAVPLELIKKIRNPAVLKFAKAKRDFMKDIFDQIIQAIKGSHVCHLEEAIPLKETNHSCYFAAVEAIHGSCFNLGENSYALEFLQYFVNICSLVQKELVIESIRKTCKDIKQVHISNII